MHGANLIKRLSWLRFELNAHILVKSVNCLCFDKKVMNIFYLRHSYIDGASIYLINWCKNLYILFSLGKDVDVKCVKKVKAQFYASLIITI